MDDAPQPAVSSPARRIVAGLVGLAGLVAATASVTLALAAGPTSLPAPPAAPATHSPATDEVTGRSEADSSTGSGETGSSSADTDPPGPAGASARPCQIGAPPAAGSGAMAPARAGAAPGALEPPLRLDLNAAAAEELMRLPGIGPHRAAQIVAWRAQHGRFRRIIDLRRIPGFGRKTVARITPFLRIASPASTTASR
jgi:competence ComEA-like helix-hairpin-helix protein